MTRRAPSTFSLLAAGLATAGLLAACGGGGGGGDSTPAPAPTATAKTTVSGNVVKGPVGAANVCAFKAVAGGKGEQLACATTDSSGAYQMDISYTGDVVLEASGGTYTDEATGSTKALAEPMQSVVTSQGGATFGVITPLTAAAFSLARNGTGGVTMATFGSAAGSVAGQFGLGSVNIATTLPVVTGTPNDYGKILKAVSQYLANGNSQATFQAFANPNALQTGFGPAYASINGSTITFTFTGATAGGTGTGTGSSAPGSHKLTINVVASGVAGPAVVLENVPKPANQTEFCGELAKPNSQLNQFSQAGGSLTINSCSFNGTVGQVAATVSITSPIAMTIPYTVTYTYN